MTEALSDTLSSSSTELLAKSIVCYTSVSPSQLNHGMLLRDIRHSVTLQLVEVIKSTGWLHVCVSFICIPSVYSTKSMLYDSYQISVGILGTIVKLYLCICLLELRNLRDRDTQCQRWFWCGSSQIQRVAARASTITRKHTE